MHMQINSHHNTSSFQVLSIHPLLSLLSYDLLYQLRRDMPYAVFVLYLAPALVPPQSTSSSSGVHLLQWHSTYKCPRTIHPVSFISAITHSNAVCTVPRPLPLRLVHSRVPGSTSPCASPRLPRRLILIEQVRSLPNDIVLAFGHHTCALAAKALKHPRRCL